MLQKVAKAVLLRFLWIVLGRKNLVRLGRFLSNEARLDVLNDPRTNGELIVQSRWWQQHKGEMDLCVFDIGANIGEWSQTLMQQAPTSEPSITVHAFEPCAGTQQTLRDNLKRWELQEWVKPHAMALSSESGQREFFSLGDNLGINSFHPLDSAEVRANMEVEEVKAQTLDEFCQERDIPRIHFIKIDTEGHDLEVLLGAKEMLASGAIDMVQFEYNMRWIYAGHFLRDAFLWLEPFGYRLGKVTPKGIEFYDAWHPELETFRESNILAVQPEFYDTFPRIPWWNDNPA